MPFRRTLSLSASLIAAVIVSVIVVASGVQADEGMWLFNHPPKKLLKEKYGFDATDAWLAHLQRSAVRFNNGGSGSFVSADGLVMTNHHVGADSIEKLSTKGRDLLQTGFYTRTRAEELKCLDMELNVLMSIEDVTQRVNDAVRSIADPAEAAKQRRAVMNIIEKESFDKTGLRSDVVSLYEGGWYHLYRCKKYTDVRLVFAPEEGAAFFGGDPDNFEYPRYDLDVGFFRVYENGEPVKSAHYLRWNPAELKEDDLTFVAGHPGGTQRMLTVRHLEQLRDCELPLRLDRTRRLEVLLGAYSQRSVENARRARELLLSCQNGRKAHLGDLAGLQDPAVMNQKRAEEASLRRAAAGRPELAAEFDAALAAIDNSIRAFAPIRDEYLMLEGAQAFHCSLFGIARTLVRMAEELPKPNAQRLREFRDSNLESLKEGLFSTAPVYEDLQTLLLADSLSAYLEQNGCCGGPKDPMIEKAMAGKGPQQRAIELMRGSKLADVAVRRQLAEGGQKAVEASDDPMILLARLVDKRSRELRASAERIGESQTQAYGKLAGLRFKLLGEDTYPDATFTLRLAFGQVKRCTEFGVPAPAWTTIGGAFRYAEEHGSVDPFALPKSWLAHKDRLNLETPLNFVSTADIIGGNSGSPVVNRNGELVGIIFDGDLPSLVWDYIFTQPEGRAVAVHGLAILEALRKIYDAGPLAEELTAH